MAGNPATVSFGGLPYDRIMLCRWAFSNMLSLRALHLDGVEWRRPDRGEFEKLMRRLRPLTNLEEISLSVQRISGDLRDYRDLCRFWRDNVDSMAQVLRSLRKVQVASPKWQTFFLRGAEAVYSSDLYSAAAMTVPIYIASPERQSSFNLL